MEFFEAGYKIKYFGVRRVAPVVVVLGCADDDVHHIGETAAATAAFFHRVIDFCGHDQLPTVLVEQRDDGVFDLFYGNEVAAANQHVVLPVIRNVLNWFYKAKEDICCQQKTARALAGEYWNQSKLDKNDRIFISLGKRTWPASCKSLRHKTAKVPKNIFVQDGKTTARMPFPQKRDPRHPRLNGNCVLSA